MKLLNSSKTGILIEVSIDELAIFENIFCCVYEIISTSEISIRFGYSLEELREFSSEICNRLLAERKQKNTQVKLKLKNDSLFILSHAFNEVCYGILISNFREKIGMDKDKLRIVFEKILDWRNHQRSLNCDHSNLT